VEQAVIYSIEEQRVLSDCTLCPRECHVSRFSGADGYCGMDSGLNISSVCIHRGEEPSITGTKGICNIFFTGCNLHCIYCQNHEISRPGHTEHGIGITLQIVLDRIEEILSQGITSVGFVSPSHVVPQVRAIIKGLNARGLSPVTVYNTNSYDKKETIQSIDDLIDIYLPDYKYVTSSLALEYSDAADYPEVALQAIREMYYQKGSTLHLNETGTAENGLLIRHLVLPGHVEESKKVLRAIAEELSPGVHISLMSQYHPADQGKKHPPLNRSLYRAEYEAVVQEMENLGFRNGWTQDMDSNLNYNPDFSKENPFG
jgi:putative pyruvate formate lyase activating enzyme